MNPPDAGRQIARSRDWSSSGGSSIPVAVIGVGALGSRHARLYDSLPQAELIGVADIDPERARSVAEQYGVAATDDYRELLPRVRAASVTVPTVAHCEVALALMESGLDILVEKPMAASVEEAREMLAMAREKKVVLGVGHTERYNPAVEAVIEYCKGPRFIEVHRLASFNPRRPGYRCRSGSHDSRSGRRGLTGSVGGEPGRGDWRAGFDRTGGHSQRASAICVGLRGQPDR